MFVVASHSKWSMLHWFVTGRFGRFGKVWSVREEMFHERIVAKTVTIVEWCRSMGGNDWYVDKGVIGWFTNRLYSLTVASTMRLAHLAGIHTFVTGGIGGVHRGGEVTMDVSADLTELSRTPVIVVCAGIKSILDIGRTLEVLETYVLLVADEKLCGT